MAKGRAGAGKGISGRSGFSRREGDVGRGYEKRGIGKVAVGSDDTFDVVKTMSRDRIRKAED